MSSDVEPEAKRAKLSERKVVSVKMAAFEGTIEAFIQPNHPKNRYGEMPDGFSCITMSPSKRYGADIQVFGEGHRSIKGIEFEKSGMIRVVDFAKLQYFYYWIDELNYGLNSGNHNRFHIIFKWLDDQSFFLIFTVPGDVTGPQVTIRKYKIDHKLMTIEEIWYWSDEFLSQGNSNYFFSIPGLWPETKGIYFFNGNCLNFVSLYDLEKDDQYPIEDRIEVQIDFRTIKGVHREDKWLIGDKFVYFISKNSHYDYLVRLSTVNLNFNDEDSSLLLDEYEKLELPASNLIFSAFNENYILLHSKEEESGFFYYLVDVNDFTSKKLDFVGKPGDFAVFYNEYVVLFNHFEDRAYPLKDTPLKYRAFQITGSSVPSLESLAGAAAVFSGSEFSTEHLRILFGFDTEE